MLCSEELGFEGEISEADRSALEWSSAFYTPNGGLQFQSFDIPWATMTKDMCGLTSQVQLLGAKTLLITTPHYVFLDY